MKTDTKKSLTICTFPMSSVDSCLAPLSSGPALFWPSSYAFVEWHLVPSLSLPVSYFVSYWFYLNILLPLIYIYPEEFNPFPYTFFCSGQKGACGEAREFITAFPLLPLHWDNLSFWAPRENMQGWKNPGFQSLYAIFPKFTWKETVNEWQSKHSSSGQWKKYKMLNRIKTLP